jgi:hypothetical protein
MAAPPGTDNSNSTAIANRPDDPLGVCERAGIAAERAGGLPSGLLLAIGRVESGRWDSARERVTGWPWTINAAGKGQWFETKSAATDTVRALISGGTRSIDVGCFQISLLYHPMAFSDLEQAFDPDANAAYATRFLLSLYGQSGSWEAAVAAYHSADPVAGFAYRRQVFATWQAAPPISAASFRMVTGLPAGAGMGSMLTAGSFPNHVAIPAVIAGVQIWTPMPPGTAATVVAMPGPPAEEQARAPVADGAATLPTVSYKSLPKELTRRR